jgi:Uma2 family endonuclease
VPARAKLTAMNVAIRKPWTQEQFFSWAEAQEARHEFDGFQPVAMTGGTVRHSAIGRNLQTALHTRLRGSRCNSLGPDAGVETVNNAVRYPDALITCSKLDGDARVVPGVVVVFEVLNPTSGASIASSRCANTPPSHPFADMSSSNPPASASPSWNAVNQMKPGALPS